MNLITHVNDTVTLAKVFNVDTGELVETVPVSGSTRQQAISMIEKVATDLLMQQDRQDDPYLASQSIGWRPQ